MDMDSHRHELRVSQEHFFLRSEIQASSSHTKDLDDVSSHTQLYDDLDVQDNARSNVIASPPVGEAHVEPITLSLPNAGRRRRLTLTGQETPSQTPFPA